MSMEGVQPLVAILDWQAPTMERNGTPRRRSGSVSERVGRIYVLFDGAGLVRHEEFCVGESKNLSRWL
jgi:hypothetical protein